MDAAFAAADEALAAGEVPIGCCFVFEHNATATSSAWHPPATLTARNETNVCRDATRHAEMVAIDRLYAGARAHLENSAECAADATKDAENLVADALRHCTLYVTIEPCAMCAAALRQCGVRTIIYGARNDRFGGLGSVLDVREIEQKEPWPVVVECTNDPRAISILKEFYSQTNPNAPNPKPKPVKNA